MQVFKVLLIGCCFCLTKSMLAQPHYVKITKPESAKRNVVFNMGTATDPKGSSIIVTPQSLLFNGKPVVPVMGEIHFSRIPENEWEKELLKMKAGGITIIATYVFWIHHEEIEGKYNWEGQRDLRKFLETCKKLDMPLVLRIGPWAHGECRNGGFPEWLVTSGVKLRNDNSEYLAIVKPWYQQIFNQAKGLLWKDGGTVIGIQLENEYRGKWEHLMTLKNMAKEIGFDVPIYTRTGWPQLSSPATFGEILPLYGNYADGFWDRSLQTMPGDYSKVFLFRSFRNSTVIATEQLPKQSEKDNLQDYSYPYLTCELGGGMMPSYHRRINIAPMDIYAMAMAKVGSGSNLPGYYMYHGGTNPEGTVTTLNEEQATGYTNYNDLPVKTYDFQAPLGEFGQINPQYHLLRRMHLFLHDFGEGLALMDPAFPDNVNDPNDTTSLRWNVRSDGNSGYVFINNYQRLKYMPPKENISFTVDLPAEEINFPASPITVPANSSSFMPFNMKLAAAVLKYATAQPVCKIKEGKTVTYFFAKNGMVPADFIFDAEKLKVNKANVDPVIKNGRIYFSNVKTGMNVAISLRDADNLTLQIVLLDEKTSLKLWKGELAGKERVFITNNAVTYHNNELELTGEENKLAVSVYPSLQSLSNGKQKLKGKAVGLFTAYNITVPPSAPLKVTLNKIANAGPLREIKIGRANVAESPKDSAFADAAVWKIELPKNTNRNRDIYLKLKYTGDVARIYVGDKLLTDNFYNGKPFEFGLKRFAKEIYGNGLILKILPLQKDAPVYLQDAEKPDFKGMKSIAALPDIEVYELYTVKLNTQ